MTNQLKTIVTESGLEKTKGQVMLDNFANYFEVAAEWESKINSFSEIPDKVEMKAAGEARKFLKRKRVEVENKRKELKEQSRKEGQAIDSISNILKNLIEPLEEKAEKIEKYEELKAEEERKEKAIERVKILNELQVAFSQNSIETMTDDVFEVYLSGLKQQKADREEQERVAELARVEQEKIKAAEQEALRLENEKLKAEAEEREKERLLLEKQARIEREARETEERKAKILADRETARLKEEADAKIAEETRKREAAEKLLQQVKDAELKQKQEAEAKAEAELSMGDKDKFDSLIKDLEAIKTKYSFKSKKYKNLQESVNELLNKTVNYAISKI